MIVTNDAMITINDGILTLSGITFLSADIMKLLSTRIHVVVSPIPAPLIADEVTASVGHIPSIWTNVGFSLTIPLYKRSVHFPIICHLHYPPPIDCTYVSPALTAFVTAFVVMVAPDRASISSSTVAPDLVYLNCATFFPAN